MSITISLKDEFLYENKIEDIPVGQCFKYEEHRDICIVLKKQNVDRNIIQSYNLTMNRIETLELTESEPLVALVDVDIVYKPSTSRLAVMV